MLRFLLPGIILLGCSTPKTATDQLVTPDVVGRIDSTLYAFVQDSLVSGVSALIFEKGQEVYFGAYGFADRENNKPMARNTVVQIFSMTKPITGVALMNLYETGAFGLDDSLTKYAPEFSGMQVFDGVNEDGTPKLVPLDRPITIRDITRHTAGFANDPQAPELGPILSSVNPGNRENTLTQMAEKMGTIPLAFQPGTKWAYGPSVDVQAFLVERISGIPYGEYVQKEVLTPLGMNETQYLVPENLKARMAAMYFRSDSGVLSRVPDEQAYAFNYQKWPLTPGGYGFTSTLDDYMKFARMLVDKGTFNDAEILKPETVALMSTNHLPDSIKERSWLPSKGQVGFGIDFAVRHSPPASVEENNGVPGEFFWDGAASTLFWVDPKNELTAVFFVQLFPYDRVGLHKKFRDAVYGPVVIEEVKK